MRTSTALVVALLISLLLAASVVPARSHEADTTRAPTAGLHALREATPASTPPPIVEPATATVPTLHAGASAGPSQSRFPHPGPIPASGPTPSYVGHYYAGSVYNATPFNSTQLSAKIHVPLDLPQGTDFYYVLLSVWDDASSYDQVGYANANGVWGFTYSSTDYCASNYYFSPDAYALTPGVTYTFSMEIASGSVTFNGTDPTGSVVFTYQQYTGGHHFVNAGFYDCNGTSYYDLTDYEEVYQTNNSVPPYVFYFSANTADGSTFAGWSGWESFPFPPGITVLVAGADTTIANTAFDLQVVSSPSSVLMVVNTSARTFNATVAAVGLVPNGSIGLWLYTLPNGWIASLSVGSGTPPFTTLVTFTVPGNSSIGNYSVGVAGGDPAGAWNQVTVFVEIVPGISLRVVVTPHPFADVGQSITIAVAAGGGIGGLIYSWSGVPSGCTGSGTSFPCVPSNAGTYPIVARAHDVGGDTGVSPTFLLLVYPDPVVTLLASPLQLDTEQTVQWFAGVTQGSGGYTYVWTGLPPGCTATTGIATCVVHAAGTYNASVRVTDSAGFSVTSGGVSVLVIPSPLLTVAASTLTADVHQPLWVNASATGGLGGFTYVWTYLPTGCSATGNRTLCSFETAGGYYVSVEARDAGGYTTLPVKTYLVISPEATVHLTAAPASLDLGQSTILATAVDGGAPGYHYEFVGLPAGCSAGDVTQVACRPNATGSYANITAIVTDANGFVFSDSLDLTVYALPTLTADVAPSSVTAGSGVTFTTVVTGGAGGALFAWQNLPGGCGATQQANVSCAPPGPGTYHVTVKVTDLNGASANASVVLTVHPVPTPWTTVGILLVVGIVVAAAVAAALVLRRRRAAARAADPSDAPAPAGEND